MSTAEQTPTVTVPRQALLDMIETLTGRCAFSMCPGPDVPPMAMATCYVCATIQDLRELAGLGAPAVGAWVVGHNVAGYLPESDTMAFADRDEAWTALFDEARRYADEDDELWEDLCPGEGHEGHGEDCYGTMRAAVDAITTDLARDPVPNEGGFSFSVEDYNDRTIVFWLQWEPTRAPGTDDLGYPLD